MLVVLGASSPFLRLPPCHMASPYLGQWYTPRAMAFLSILKVTRANPFFHLVNPSPALPNKPLKWSNSHTFGGGATPPLVPGICPQFMHYDFRIWGYI